MNDNLIDYRYKYKNENSAVPMRSLDTNYHESFSKENNKQLSVQQEPNIKYQTENEYVVISSADRDPVAYPNPNNFIINLNKPIKNIICAELCGAVLANKAATGILTDNPIIAVDIKELNHINFTNVQNSKAFAILQIKNPTTGSTTSGFAPSELGLNFHTILELKTPIAEISRLSISIRNQQGDILDYGAGSLGSTAPEFNNYFTINFKTLVKSFNEIKNRSIFS